MIPIGVERSETFRSPFDFYLFLLSIMKCRPNSREKLERSSSGTRVTRGANDSTRCFQTSFVLNLALLPLFPAGNDFIHIPSLSPFLSSILDEISKSEHSIVHHNKLISLKYSTLFLFIFLQAKTRVKIYRYIFFSHSE